MRFGFVEVQVQIANGVLTNVAVPIYPNGTTTDQTISTNDLPTLRSEALAAVSSCSGQTLHTCIPAAVTAISGATYTSDAFKLSLASALTKAGL